MRKPQSTSLAIFGWLFAAYFLLILLPILRADRYTNDDIIRALNGNWGWNTDGRLLTNVVMRVLEFGSARVVDIAPLPQVLAIAVLALVGVLLARRFAIESVPAAVLVAFPLGAQPFFLQNLAFRFDAFCMALAMLLAALPILTLRGSPRDWLVGGICLLASLNLYQPAICVFLVFALLEAIAEPSSPGRPAAATRRLLARGLQGGVAMGSYQLLFGSSFKGWIKDRSAIAPLSELPHAIVANMEGFFRFALGSFSERWLGFFLPLAVVTALCPALLFARTFQRESRTASRWLALGAGAFVAVFVTCAAIGGPMLLLRNAVLAPRVMVGLGTALCAALVAASLVLRCHARGRIALQVLAGVWALGMATHAAVFGNAAAAQKTYETSIATQLSDDLAAIGQHRPLNRYLVVGSPGLAPVTAHAASQFPLLHELVPVYLAEDEVWRHNYLLQYLPTLQDAAFPDDSESPKLATRACANEPVVTRSAYQVSTVEDVAVVRFRSSPCPA